MNWLANIKLMGPRPPGSILLLGAHLNWGIFKHCCRGPILIGWQKLRRPGPIVSMLLLITVVRVYLLYAKMLKITKTKETIVFFVRFLSLVAFQLGGPGPPGCTYGL